MPFNNLQKQDTYNSKLLEKVTWSFWVKKPYSLYVGLKNLAKINKNKNKNKNWYIMKIKNRK